MYKGYKIVVVMPAYNAALTLGQTFEEIDLDLVDEVILVDDKSVDDTAQLARALGIHHVIEHRSNLGYGGNQKTCYDKALEIGADIIIMIHPDYQYTPKLIPAMVSILSEGVYPVVYGSRILGNGALKGGMPIYKYIANRILTLIQNILMNQKLSEYHTGYRAYRRDVLLAVDYHKNSQDFVFDNQISAQILGKGFEIAEVTTPTKYFKEASSINFTRSIKYGLGVVGVSMAYFLHRIGIKKWDKLS